MKRFYTGMTNLGLTIGHWGEGGRAMVRALKLALIGVGVATLTLFAPAAFPADIMHVDGAPALSAKTEKAVSWRAMKNVRSVSAIKFRPLSAEVLKTVQEENSPGSSDQLQAKAIKIGISRNADTEIDTGTPFILNWQNNGDGYVAQWTVTSPGASGLRAGLLIGALPGNAELRFSGSDAPDKIIGVISGQETGALLDDDGVYWTPVTEGETQNIEIYLPLTANLSQDVNIRLNAVSHLFTSANENFSTEPVVKASQYCEVDVACKYASLGTAFQNTSKAVARMIFQSGGSSYQCTGTLLSNSSGSQTPYFWTAAHCISTQAEANTLNTYWFYEAANCNSSQLNPDRRQLSGGARLLHAKASTDTTLLLLNDPIPAGAYLSGWDATRFSSGAMIGIHHPAGDIKKVSVGNGEGATCNTRFSYMTDLPQLDLSTLSLVSWSDGVTEPGSSGSGLFTLSNGAYSLRGGLMGGSSSCSTMGLSVSRGNADCYSSLYLVYDEVKQWLAPSSSVTYTITASAGTGGTISPSGSVTGVSSGTTRTFTVTPNSGYSISSVGGTCGGSLSGNTYTTNAITANCTVTASFAQTVTYTVTASAGTGGTISPSGAVSVTRGATRAFTVTPNSGYSISSVGGTCGGSLSGNTYTTNAITANCTVTASFAQAATYTITASAGTGGTISPSGSVTGVVSGTTRAFTVTPNSGYSISSVGGTCGGSLSSNTYTTNAITANCTVTAAFTSAATGPTVTLTSLTPSGGTSSPAVGTATAVSQGGSVTYTITPPAGATNGSWTWSSGCGNVATAAAWNFGSNLVLKVGAVTGNCTFQVTFTVANYTVTSSAGTGGTISPAGASTVPFGTTKTYTVTPNSGYSISSVGGTCAGTLSGNTYTTKIVTANCTVVASFAPTTATTYTITASAGTGGTISPSGSVTGVSSGTTRAFTVTPNSGYSISSVGGTCGGSLSGNTYTTNAITANCTVTASFAQTVTYTVTASAGTGGTISPSGAVSVARGATRAFTVTPNSGYGISSVGGTCGGSLSGNTYTTNAITANCTVTASFAQSTYTVTASAGTGGTISPSGAVSVTSGATQAFTVTPNSGYGISSIGGTCGGSLSGNTYTTNAITANCTVTASFSQITYTITASAGTGGTISPSGNVTGVVSGTTRAFTVTPNSGYGISSVGGTCGGALSGNTYTTNAITANCTVTASFAQTVTYTVTASAGTGGTISPSGAVAVTRGATRAFTVTPNSGYGISSVGGTCGGSLSGNTYTTNAITANCTVTASFTAAVTGTTVTLTSLTPSGTSSPAVGTATAVSQGGNVTYTITPPAGATNASWSWSSGCGNIVLAAPWPFGSNLVIKVGAVTSNCTFQVTFTVTNYTVTSSAGTGGTISPAGASTVPFGTTRTYTVTPNSGYSISSVGGTCGGSLSGNTYTTKAITANCTVTASFTSAATGPTVTLTSLTPSGTSSPAVGTATAVSQGGSLTYTITPPAGASYASWTWSNGCGNIVMNSWPSGSNLVIKVGAVTSNCTFQVAFR